MSNTKCEPDKCLKGQYCDTDLYACTSCSRVCQSKLEEDKDYCKSQCQGFDLTKYIEGQPVKQTKTEQSSQVPVASTLRPQHDQQVSNSSKAAVGFSLHVYIAIIVIALMFIAILVLGFVAYKFLKSRKKNNRNSLQHVPKRSDRKESTTKPDEIIPLNLYPVGTLSLAYSYADVEKGVPSLYGNNPAFTKDLKVQYSGGDSRLGAVGGANLHLQQDIAPVPMANMYDNDSGCGSARNNGTRPSEVFEQMNRLIYREREINMNRLGQPHSGGDSLQGAVGGENLLLQQDIALVPTANMNDKDSRCGSVRNNGTRPSEEFEQMNRPIDQERGINMERLGQPLLDSGGDSRLGAVGGANPPLQQDIAPVPMENTYDHDSGCGSVQTNSTGPNSVRYWRR